MIARYDDGGIRGRVAFLVMDTARGGAKGALDGWIGERNAAALWALRSRYIAILTVNTGGNPRYAHNIECASDISIVIDALARFQLLIERTGYDLGLGSPGTPNACLIDVRLRLEASDTARVDAWLDDHCREFLLRSDVVAGSA